jgi:hypothetical protein
MIDQLVNKSHVARRSFDLDQIAQRLLTLKLPRAAAILAEGAQGSLIIAIDARQIRASKESGHRLNENADLAALRGGPSPLPSSRGEASREQERTTM